MREIKFRAWDKVGKKMVKNAVKPKYINAISGPGMTIHFNDYISDKDYILMQFTGLLDKNGVEIYEGDIVRCPITEGSTDYLHLEAGTKGFVIRTISIPEVFMEGLPDDCEIMGNIYENEDILKQCDSLAGKL